MNTPSIAHFGTTIIESPPPAGMAQADVPKDGQLGDMLRFLETLGFSPAVENLYQGIGRQYIWTRGSVGDVDYVEQDNFTSYVAERRPDSSMPRVGDTIFRLTHAHPVAALQQLLDDQLAVPVSDSECEEFLHNRCQWVLLTAPNGQIYQFGATQPFRHDNHAVFIWTASTQIAANSQAYQANFGFHERPSETFHDLGEAVMLQREEPGMSIGFLSRSDLMPRWTADIFKEAGYAHFRLGAPDKDKALAASREAFPPAGDVSFVYFADSYLELVQT